MRLVLISLVAWLMISCGEIEPEPSVKGHWFYCDENMGYTELVISDSTIHQLSYDVFGMVPLNTVLQDNKAISKYDTTYYIKLFSATKAIVYSKNQLKDTLYRLTEPAKTFFDYDCSTGMTFFAFRDILHNEFAIRSIKYGNKCPTTLRSELQSAELATLDLSELEKEMGLITDRIRMFKSEFQILNDTIESKPELLSIEFSNDSTKALLTLDVWENTMSDFEIDVHQDSAKVIQIESYHHNEICKEYNTIRLSILIEFENKPNVKAIVFNGEILQ